MENDFLVKLVKNTTYLEPLAKWCTEVWVFHLHMEQKTSFKYPRSGWFLDQPTALVAVDESVNSTWPFVVEGRRHGIEGHDVYGERFVYS